MGRTQVPLHFSYENRSKLDQFVSGVVCYHPQENRIPFVIAYRYQKAAA